MKYFIGKLIVIAVFICAGSAQALTPIEQKISANVLQQQTAQILLLEKLVNINSGTTNLSGVTKVGKILQFKFDQLGFKTTWISEPEDMHRASTLVAERQGHAGKKLLLIGHLDTVFPKDDAFQKFTRHGTSATGPGVIDDKGGDVVILYALQALAAANALDDASITVILTGDEEDSGKPAEISRQPLFDAASHCDAALDFEWAITSHTATTARRGIVRWTLDTQGIEAHSSKIFQPGTGDGAIFEMARILNTLRTNLSDEKHLSFSPGIMLGGSKIDFNNNTTQGFAAGKDNVIAKMGMTKGDLRYLTDNQKLAVERKMLAIVNQHLPGTTASIHFQEGFPGMPPSAENVALLNQYSKASTDLGYGKVTALDPDLRGAGDISHIARLVPAKLAGLGVVGTGAHSDKETLDIPSLTMQTQRAALLIYRLTH